MYRQVKRLGAIVSIFLRINFIEFLRFIFLWGTPSVLTSTINTQSCQVTISTIAGSDRLNAL